MRVLICGGRDFIDVPKFNMAMMSSLRCQSITMVVTGGAKGADTLAKKWADSYGIHCAVIDALWDVYNRSAGILRNTSMLSIQPDMCIAFPGGTGTADMIRQCEQAGVTVWRPYP